MSGGYPASSPERRAQPQPRDAASAPTELSSSQGIRARRHGAARCRLEARQASSACWAWALLAAGGATAGVHVAQSAERARRRERAQRRQRERRPCPRARCGAGRQRAARRSRASPTPALSAAARRAAVLSAAAAPPKRGATALGVPWPGTQFRQVAAGTLERADQWLDAFRIVRRPEAAANLDARFPRLRRARASACAPSRSGSWRAARSPKSARIARSPTAWSRAASSSAAAARCGERSCVRSPQRRRADFGLCCERSIGMTSKNLQKQFLSSTGSVLKKLENALNQHDADGADGLAGRQGEARRRRAQQSLGRGAVRPNLQSRRPISIVTHESCDVSVQANKVVKRSKRGRKVTRATRRIRGRPACKQMRHQRGEATLASAEYVFSPASKLRSISAKNQASE